MKNRAFFEYLSLLTDEIYITSISTVSILCCSGSGNARTWRLALDETLEMLKTAGKAKK